MKKRIALIVALFTVALGLYSVIPHDGKRSADAGSDPSGEVSAEIEEKFKQALASAGVSEEAMVRPQEQALQRDLGGDLGGGSTQVDEASSAGVQAPRDPYQMENVEEQVKLALDMGYIEESQVEEFRLQREELNSLRQAREESEMTEGLQEGVLP